MPDISSTRATDGDRASPSRRALLRRALEVLPIAAWSTDAQLRFVEWHPSTGPHLPWRTRNGDMPSDIADAYASDDLPSPLLALHERALRGQTARADIAVGERVLDVCVAPARDGDGSVVGTIGTALDITERRQQQEALIESEERHRRLVDSCPEALAVHRDGELLFVNQAAAALYGMDAPEQLVGRSVYDFVPDEQREEVEQRLAALAAGDATLPPLESVVVRGDGTRRDVEFVSTPITYRGEPAVQTAVRDVTERREREAEQRLLQSQVQRAQKMEALGRLAGGIAHDFNNLIAVIRSYSDFLMQALPADAEMRDDVGEIRAASERAASLTRQLLVLSRREPLEPQVIDVNDVVEEVERLTSRLLPSWIERRTGLADELPPVLADRSQLEQVLLNLVVNARDAMPRGGQLAIETAVEVLDERRARRTGDRPAGRYVRLTVRDTGTGMSDDVMAHLFEPFFTTKPAGEGTGLGLSTVYGIVRAAGGDVVVQSREGSGTRVDVLLPAAAPASAGGSFRGA